MKDHWLLVCLGYENKQDSINNLLVNFRYFSKKPMQAEVLIPFPAVISSYPIKNDFELSALLNTVSQINSIDDVIIYSPKKKNLPYFNIVNPSLNFDIVNIFMPNNHKLIKNLPRTKFQIGSYTKIIKRILDVQDRELEIDSSLELALIRKDELTTAQRELEYIINKLSLQYKPHLILNELFDLFLVSENENEFLKILKTKRNISNNLDRLDLDFILKKRKEIIEASYSIEDNLKKVDPQNIIFPDKENLDYKILLNYSKENRNEVQRLGVKGIKFSDKRLSLKELNKQPKVILDLEKPLWKFKFEKPLLEAREELINLLKKNPINEEILANIKNLERLLTVKIDDITIPLFDEKYNATISNYVLLKILGNGTRIREYHKIRNTSDEDKNKIINNFQLFLHENERDLMNEVFHSINSIRPYLTIAYNAPYDIIQSREASVELKLGKFDIGAKGKKPRRPIVRKIYQKVEIPGVEIYDPYRTNENFYQYQDKHKLADFVSFVRKLDGIEEEFKKISTHEELRELKIRAMHGDKEADFKLDHYTTSDGEVLDLDYSYYLKTIFMIKELAPHLSFTDINFSPKASMIELHKKLFYDRYHHERFFGYQKKIRNDEEIIFKKHYEILKKNLLKRNGVEILHPTNSNNVLQAYMPPELWLKDVLISIYPKWKSYFDNIEKDEHGMLQYPHEFLEEILKDYYFYIKEKNTYINNIKSRNLDGLVIKEILFNLDAILHKHEINLLGYYNNTYNNLRNLFRSVYVKFPISLRNVVRINPTHLEYNEPSNLFFENQKMFEIDNMDLVLTYNLPLTLERLMNEDAKSLLKKYRSLFNTFNKISQNLESLVSQEFVNSNGLSGNDLIYLLNLRKRANREYKEFLMCYNFDPEEFDKLFLGSFRSLAKELNDNEIGVIDIRGDYLFLNGILPINTMLIPLRYKKLEKKQKLNEEQLNLF